MNDLRVGTTFRYEGEPYQALKISHLKMGRGSAVVGAKIKNLRTGSTLERNFKPSDRFDDLDIEKKPADYLYTDGDACHFMDEDYEQFSLPKGSVQDQLPFMKESAKVDIVLLDGSPTGVELPPKVNLEVKDAPPAVRGDTAGSVTKTATLETGAEIQVPIFVKTGDVIRINTETGEYVERVTK